MALKLTLPKTNLPARAEGTIDGIVPVRFEDHGDRWSLQIGSDWHYEVPHDLPPARRTGRAIVLSIYHAVSCYRNASRGVATGRPA